GKLPFRGRSLSITQVSVEEDSCREVSDQGHLIVWRTDRLGMPLIETVTGPDLRTPEEVEEAILLVGRVCRSTNHVRTGIGASRQDVNVSVRGGSRVEIKGVPKAGWAPKLVHGEAARQVNLLKLCAELHRRGFEKPDSIRIEHADVTELLTSSPLSFLHRENWERFLESAERRPGFEMGKGPFCVRAIRLRGLAGTLSWPGQPVLTFAHELAGRVRVIACLDQDPILLHSEKWPDYMGAREELERVRKRVHCRPEDGLVVVWGAEEDTVCAADEIRIRYGEATIGVPNETRQPYADGFTDFERILPGPDRMYPDTDSPPQRITRERVDGLRYSLPEPPWEREERYGKSGVPRDVIFYLIRRGGARLVDLVVRQSAADIRQACFFFGEKIKGLRRDGVSVDKIRDEQWCEFFRLVKEKPVLMDAWKPLVKRMALHTEDGLEEFIREKGLGDSPERWREQAMETVRTAKFEPLCSGRDTADPRTRFLMGRIMNELRGQVQAEDVASILRDTLEKEQ
ncbi:MAG: hypothetical protein KJ645_09290, partial [Planctomycetes bacterium]|nr:hypothetical protein [Planctomycetota bacterium]